jgi:hypothetical protein
VTNPLNLPTIVIIEGHDALAAAMIQCKQRLNRPALVRTCARKIQGIAASLPLLAMTSERSSLKQFFRC